MVKDDYGKGKENMIKAVLFPSSILDRRKIDEDMAKEYSAVLQTGLFDTIIFGYDEWFNNQMLALTSLPKEKVSAVYRGWMMKPEKYAAFYNYLFEQNIELVTTPEMYSLMHIFPNIYPKIQEDTARIMTFPLHSRICVEAIKHSFRRFMVKDYVKSVKGTDFPAYFDREVTQDEFDRWMEVFYKYRADLLTGGICIKEYLNLKRYAGKTNEFRVFYMNHEVISICRNSLQEDYTAEPPRTLIDKYACLDSVYYTLDYAELEDGTWKIVEAGDGSVSGLSDGQDYASFFRSLYHAMGYETKTKL